jgi:hypothetical protein
MHSFKGNMIRSLAVASLLMSSLAVSALPSTAAAPQVAPGGGKYKDCHGYVLHVSLQNVRVHCIDGVPADLSFVTYPKFVDLPDGKTVETVDLKPKTPVHVIFSDAIGIRHAYKIYVANPNGHGLYGFKA